MLTNKLNHQCKWKRILAPLTVLKARWLLSKIQKENKIRNRQTNKNCGQIQQLLSSESEILLSRLAGAMSFLNQQGGSWEKELNFCSFVFKEKKGYTSSESSMNFRKEVSYENQHAPKTRSSLVDAMWDGISKKWVTQKSAATLLDTEEYNRELSDLIFVKFFICFLHRHLSFFWKQGNRAAEVWRMCFTEQHSLLN